VGYWVDVWRVKVRRRWGEIRGWGFMYGDPRPREAALNLGAAWGMLFFDMKTKKTT